MRFGHGASTAPRELSGRAPAANVSSGSTPSTHHERSVAPAVVTTALAPSQRSATSAPPASAGVGSGRAMLNAGQLAEDGPVGASPPGVQDLVVRPAEPQPGVHAR